MAESPNRQPAPDVQVELKRSPRSDTVESAECLISEESCPDSLVVISHARIAASSARMAARLCIETVIKSQEVRKITTERMDAADYKAESKRIWWRCLGSSEVNRFRDITQKCQDALRVLMEMVVRAGKAAAEALAAARFANHQADELRLSPNTQSEDVLNRHQSIKTAAEAANNKAKLADQERYLLLLAMKECMEEADYMTTPIVNFSSYTFGNRMVRIVPPLLIFTMLFTGSTFLYLTLQEEFEEDETSSSFKGSLGIVIALSGSVIVTYLLNRGYTWWKECESMRREEKRKQIVKEAFTLGTRLRRMEVSVPSLKDVKDEVQRRLYI